MEMSPSEIMDLLQQRGTLRRLVQEAFDDGSQPVAGWRLRAEIVLAKNNFAEYEMPETK